MGKSVPAFLTSASQRVSATPSPPLTGLVTPTFPEMPDTQAGALPKPRTWSAFLSSLDISLQSTSGPGAVWGFCQTELQRPKTVPPKAQGLEVPCRLGCRADYQQEDDMNAGAWQGELARARQVGTATDSLVTSVHVVMEFRTPRQDPTSFQRRKQVTHKGTKWYQTSRLLEARKQLGSAFKFLIWNYVQP